MLSAPGESVSLKYLCSDVVSCSKSLLILSICITCYHSRLLSILEILPKFRDIKEQYFSCKTNFKLFTQVHTVHEISSEMADCKFTLQLSLAS